MDLDIGWYNVNDLRSCGILKWRKICPGPVEWTPGHNYIDLYCKGNEDEKESVNDDLNWFFEDLHLGKEPDYYAHTYFLPQLTEAEIELVEEKDSDFIDTFAQKTSADVKKTEMVSSESDSKYVEAWGHRTTYTIENAIK